MTHFNLCALNSILNKSLLILIASYLCFSCTPTTPQSDYSNTLESAISSLIKHDTDSKMSLNYATSLKLTEVYKVYYTEVVKLPKKDRALFFYILDNNINVTGGSNLFDYYNLVYSCCKKEYINLIKQNIDNPYFDSNVLKNKLSVIENSEARIKESAFYQGMSEDEYLRELKEFYLSQD